jgi:hypothetical protein
MTREVLDTQRRMLGPEHPNALNTMGNLACSLSGQGRHAEAELMEREVLDIQRRMLGPEHPRPWGSLRSVLWSWSIIATCFIAALAAHTWYTRYHDLGGSDLA